MRIVVLDGYGLNPGDLSWDPYGRLGRLTTYERSGSEEVEQRARNAEILLVDQVQLDGPLIRRLLRLHYIGVFGTGYDNVDIDAARERGVVVTNVPGYSTASVAQMTFALILHLAAALDGYTPLVQSGAWTQGRNFIYLPRPLIELESKTLGVIGYGAIGQRVAHLGHAFGMYIAVWSQSRKETDGLSVHWCELDELLSTSDVVTLHVPLTESTRYLINAKSLSLMKPTALLINTARGGLVQDVDLADALNSGRLAGAGLDVLSCTEPPEAENPLLGAKNCIITPHIAWATRASRLRCLTESAANLEAFLAGRSRNRVV